MAENQHFWRSLGDCPDFRAGPQDGSTKMGLSPSAVAQGEAFPGAGRPYLADDAAAGVDRRRWMQLMGASLALATASGCRWEKDEIRPFERRPENRVPGARQRFATTMDLGGDPLGLLVTCVDGRPIKVEGNPLHPSSLGATHAFAQAAILELYDPDRSRHIHERAGGRDDIRTPDEFREFAAPHFAKLRENRGRGLAIVAPRSCSPTTTAYRKRLLGDLPQALWCEFDPLWAAAFARPNYHLDKAEVIVSLDADLLGLHPQAVRYAREFADRRIGASGNRLYVVESGLSITGAAADHRLPLQAGKMVALLVALQQEVERAIAGKAAGSGGSPVERFIRAMADDLVAHRGRAVIAPGLTNDALFTLAAEVNHSLGAVGTLIDYIGADDEGLIDLDELTAALTGGKVDALVVLGGNPVYTAPTDGDFAAALKKAKTSIHLGLYRDETARACDWHVPAAHFLESWGDARTVEGVYSVVQPMIAPLYAGLAPLEMLALVAGDRRGPREIVREHFATLMPDEEATKVEERWRRTLHDGLLANITLEPAPTTAAMGDGMLPLGPPDAPWNGQLELVYRFDSGVLDGRFANNAWLQEFPDPISRLTWGNALWLGPETAERTGVADGSMVSLKVEGRELTVPALIVPGMAPGSLSLALGYGRTEAGRVGGSKSQQVEAIGVNAYVIRTSRAPWHVAGVELTPLGTKATLRSVQEHFAIDTAGYEARAKRVPVLVREFPNGVHESHHAAESLWTERTYEGHRWALTVDLARCNGCGACVVACQAENNIPVVGPERVAEGREMHWLRVDRYFGGDPAAPKVVFQPMMCQQCELAPCEAVCPVNATVHSSEGLNDMVYNRCVGTRYCGNNCPYKVRRFNYFNYQTLYDDPANAVRKMANNPEVTVRSRGVMEKCTYCVQRIQAAKIEAKNQRRSIADGEIKTACQQACPAGAIVFGDLGPAHQPPATAVARAFDDPRSYEPLEELHHNTRTRYLAKMRNPNDVLEDR